MAPKYLFRSDFFWKIYYNCLEIRTSQINTSSGCKIRVTMSAINVSRCRFPWSWQCVPGSLAPWTDSLTSCSSGWQTRPRPGSGPSTHAPRHPQWLRILATVTYATKAKAKAQGKPRRAESRYALIFMFLSIKSGHGIYATQPELFSLGRRTWLLVPNSQLPATNSQRFPTFPSPGVVMAAVVCWPLTRRVKMPQNQGEMLHCALQITAPQLEQQCLGI